jgi:hypothetical protein
MSLYLYVRADNNSVQSGTILLLGGGKGEAIKAPMRTELVSPECVAKSRGYDYVTGTVLFRSIHL